MESEPKARVHHRKRRERAQKLQLDLSDSEGEKIGDDQSPLRGSKERSRSKPRKKKSPGTYEEDFIDGFAIISFKTKEELQKFTQGKLTNKSGGDKCTPKRNNSISPARHIHRHQHVKKKDKTQTNLSKSKKHNNSAADSESSGETTDHLDTSNLILNGPKKTISRRFSDVSTRSSSGAGYLCDSESGDERVSDASLDIFKPINNSIITCERNVTSLLPPVSTHSATITTATHTTTTTGSDVTATIVSTTTSCIPLVTSSQTTTSVNVTTAHHIVNTTTCSSQHVHQHNHLQPVVNQSYHKVTSADNKFIPADNKYSSLDNRYTSVDNKYSTADNKYSTVDNKYSSVDSKYSLGESKFSSVESKYSSQLNQQKIHTNNNNVNKDVSHTNNFQSVIKRRPLSPPPLTKSRPPSPRHKSISHPLLPASSSSTSLSSIISNPVIHRESRRPTPPSRAKTPRREDSRERETYQQLPPSLAVSKSFFSPGFSGHGPSAASIYSPLGPSPGLHPIHSTPPSHTPTFPGSSVIPSLHQHHQSTPQPHPNMFAPPLPLGLPGGPIPGSLSGAPSSHITSESPLSISNPDLLREELNRRFLASQDRSSLLGSIPPLMRADIHQHMHQHQHQHMHQHQHTYGGMPPPAISAPSLVPTPTPSPFDKVPPSNPFFRQGIPGLQGYPSPLPDALHSGIPGAFQPKGITTLHPAVGPLFIAPGRDLDKSPAHIPQAPQSNLPTTAKKPGKWCAVHVRIAWEIYHHQQKNNSDKGSDSKPSDPLRPPSHLIQGPSLARPPDLPNSANSTLLGSGRGMFDSNPHTLLNSASHLASSFPRPAPYSIGSSLPLGMGNGLMSTSREAPPSVPSGSQDWGRLHRPSSSTFSSPWTKTEDREKEERESMDRRREEDRERERRLLEQERHRFSSLDDRGRDRDRYRESEMLAKSRSRSRSPMRNGRSDSVKSERSFERRSEDSGMNVMKVKEEKRESLTREDDLMVAAAAERERERLMKNEYIANSIRTGDPFLQGAVMDRARMLNPASAYSVTDRVPPHPSLWNPFDKGPVDFQNIRLNLQREMEQAREQLLLNRFPGPGLQQGFPGLSPFEQERFRDEMILREKRERDYLERLPAFTRERMFYENSKIQGIRPQDHLTHPSLSNSFSRNSPALHNHIKRSSPAILPGAPPPLIHSVSAHSSRGHNSPAVNKSKGVSPIDSVGESKRDSNSNSTDPDVHSR
ncbi:autism susceptibility gene 2 protein-like isoform X3 [Ruditapes philippinarum]|uniref:autism susceptibility gene 2 protein-like isoform X3 n=1 Tax=Ruditapes philippinarum TaxID=129788 RepID=UPI00295C0542|nr:autism susceptibility gene 2 protein-like isoform X3 [Ruditapes philippinarum]